MRRLVPGIVDDDAGGAGRLEEDRAAILIAARHAARGNAVDIGFHRYVADILMIVLLVFFGMRFAKNRKFMPGGFMVLLTVLALALRHIPIT